MHTYYIFSPSIYYCHCHLSSVANHVVFFHWKILALAKIWIRDVPGTKPICYQLSYPGLDSNLPLWMSLVESSMIWLCAWRITLPMSRITNELFRPHCDEKSLQNKIMKKKKLLPMFDPNSKIVWSEIFFFWLFAKCWPRWPQPNSMWTLFHFL